MELSDSEQKVLLKIYDTCFISLSENVSSKSLYNILSKDYLWITLRSLEKKGLIISHISNRQKIISVTSIGKKATYALATIRKL